MRLISMCADSSRIKVKEREFLVSWECITAPKTLAVLGVRTARRTNVALLGKSIVDILTKNNKLWVDIFQHHYLGNGHLFQCIPSKIDSYV